MELIVLINLCTYAQKHSSSISDYELENKMYVHLFGEVYLLAFEFMSIS